MNISKYNDIELNKNGYSYIMKYCSANIDVEYDWFDYHVSTGGSADIYDIEKQNSVVGYVALYDYDCTNRSVYLYGKVSERQYFGDLLKAILSVMDYAFTSLNVNKINFVYREDNYFFDDLCRFLHFVKEGILRNHLLTNNEYRNLNVYGLLLSEYREYKASEYKRMFTWDNDYQTYPDNDISMETWLEFGEGTYLDMSSIEIVQFIIDLEEKYSIIIDIEDRYYTVGDAVQGVVSYLREKAEDMSEEACESEL